MFHYHVDSFNKLSVSLEKSGDSSMLIVLGTDLKTLFDWEIFFLDEALDDCWRNVDFFVVDELT